MKKGKSNKERQVASNVLKCCTYKEANKQKKSGSNNGYSYVSLFHEFVYFLSMTIRSVIGCDVL